MMEEGKVVRLHDDDNVALALRAVPESDGGGLGPEDLQRVEWRAQPRARSVVARRGHAGGKDEW